MINSPSLSSKARVRFRGQISLRSHNDDKFTSLDRSMPTITFDHRSRSAKNARSDKEKRGHCRHASRLRLQLRSHPRIISTGGNQPARYLYDEGSVRYWPSRDPIGERGGINLYGMVGNNAVNTWDILGLAPPDFNSGGWGMGTAPGDWPGPNKRSKPSGTSGPDWTDVFKSVVESYILDTPSVTLSINHTFPIPVPKPYYVTVSPGLEGKVFKCKSLKTKKIVYGFQVSLSVKVAGGLGTAPPQVKRHGGVPRGVPRNSPEGKRFKKLQGKPVPFFRRGKLGGSGTADKTSEENCDCPDEGLSASVEVGVEAYAEALIFTISGTAKTTWKLGESFKPNPSISTSAGAKPPEFTAEAGAGIFGKGTGTWTKIYD